MVKVFFRHLRKLDYCADGIVEWCARHGINPRDFKRNRGVPADRMRATGCPLGVKAADLAEREAAE